MSPKVRLRQRARVVLQMVMGFMIMILLAQLWLFTVTLDAMESRHASMTIPIVALVCSFVGLAAVWGMTRLFLRMEENQ
jgi:hypothetical protein